MEKEYFAHKDGKDWEHVYGSMASMDQFGNSLVYKVKIRDLKEGEESKYWAWKEFKDSSYHFVQSSEIQVHMCDPNLETKINNNEGDLVQVVIEGIGSVDEL